MKLADFYKAVVAAGIAADPRSGAAIRDELKRVRKKHKGLKGTERDVFDTESLENPFADTRILHGTGEEEVRRIMVGIDVDPGELLLADRLKEKGEALDAVVSHHPSGRALADLGAVMGMQADILAQFGVPISAAEALMSSRIKEVERRLMSGNHTRAADAAKLLGIPLMCMHTPADNHVTGFLQALVDEKKPGRLSDILELLLALPEYLEAAGNGQGPRILLGDKDRKAGRVFVEMTGGTSGNKKLFENIAAAGVNTIVGMHMSDEHREEAKKHHINVIIAGHISSDTLGMNLLLDSVARNTGASLDVVECSGFRRFPRL